MKPSLTIVVALFLATYHLSESALKYFKSDVAGQATWGVLLVFAAASFLGEGIGVLRAYFRSKD